MIQERFLWLMYRPLLSEKQRKRSTASAVTVKVEAPRLVMSAIDLEEGLMQVSGNGAPR
jgi:hypothetical protein